MDLSKKEIIELLNDDINQDALFKKADENKKLAIQELLK